MSASNSVTLLGRCVFDAKQIENDNYWILEWRIAVRTRRDSDAEFFDLKMIRRKDDGRGGQTNDFSGLANVLRPGKEILVTGVLRHESWKTAEGENRSRVRVQVDDITLLRDPSGQDPTFGLSEDDQKIPF